MIVSLGVFSPVSDAWSADTGDLRRDAAVAENYSGDAVTRRRSRVSQNTAAALSGGPM